MKTALAAALLILASPAAAEPLAWEGTWRAEGTNACDVRLSKSKIEMGARRYAVVEAKPSAIRYDRGLPSAKGPPQLDVISIYALLDGSIEMAMPYPRFDGILSRCSDRPSPLRPHKVPP